MSSVSSVADDPGFGQSFESVIEALSVVDDVRYHRPRHCPPRQWRHIVMHAILIWICDLHYYSTDRWEIVLATLIDKWVFNKLKIDANDSEKF